MAVLDDTNRLVAWADLMRSAGCPAGVTKPDLRAALNAADAWADANAASYNAALPLPARTAMTAKEKAALLMFVIARRHKVA
jgi:hypothetical protein